MKRQAKSLL